MFNVIIEAYGLANETAKEVLVGTVLDANVSGGLIGGDRKEYAVEWSKNQVKNIVAMSIADGCVSNVEAWAVDSVLEKENIDAKFLYFFTNPDCDYKKWIFKVKVNEVK